MTLVTRVRAGLLPVGLVALCALPLTAGAMRLVQLAGGPAAIPADPRFAGLPVALIVHLLATTVFALAALAQLMPGFRRRHPGWHRRAGRILVAAGLLVSASALWLTVFEPFKPGTGVLLMVLRLVFAPAMAGCLLLGVAAAKRRDLAAHRVWMVRAYAIAVAAGTQAFTGGIGGALLGTGVLAADLAKGAGWAINLAVAEWFLRRPARARAAARAGAQAEARA